MSKITFIPSLFFEYATCPDWIWFDRYGDQQLKGEIPELAQKLLEQGVLHEEEYIADLDVTSVDAPAGELAYQTTVELMKQGVPYIYQGAIRMSTETVHYQGRPDLLEKRSGHSAFGEYYYTPIDIKNSTDLKREHWLQLTLYAMILENVQQRFPNEVAIINRDKIRIDYTLTETHRTKTQAQVNEIISVMQGQKPPLKLVSKCKNSPWFQQCIRQAENANDIALIYKLDSRASQGLRQLSIHTVTQLAELNPDHLPKIPHLSAHTLQRAQAQARSLMTGEIIWRAEPHISDSALKIYFDIEGDPLLQVEYLFGFWVVGDPLGKYAKFGQVRDYPDEGKYYIYFIAEHPDDESTMWQQFRQWVNSLPEEYLVYHFADYERSRTKGLAVEYETTPDTQFDAQPDTQPALTRFFDALVDLSKVVQSSVIFPLYFYSIKDIAKSKFVDYRWRHPKAGGAQSIFWYEKWLETGDRQVLDDIINYNEDDVVATEYLHQWLMQKNDTKEKSLDN